MGSTILLSIIQVAAGGSLVQILIRFGGFIYRRFTGTEQRQSGINAASVDTAADVLIMVRSELKEVRAQQALDRQAWDAERVLSTTSMNNASREIARANSELARRTADLAVAQALIAELGGRIPGRHASP